MIRKNDIIVRWNLNELRIGNCWKWTSFGDGWTLFFRLPSEKQQPMAERFSHSIYSEHSLITLVHTQEYHFFFSTESNRINYLHHKTVWQWSRIKYGYENCLYLIENSSFFWIFVFVFLVNLFIYGELLYWVPYLEQIASTETLQYGTRSQTEHRLLDWLWC